MKAARIIAGDVNRILAIESGGAFLIAFTRRHSCGERGEQAEALEGNLRGATS